jgi:hypothetical protein
MKYRNATNRYPTAKYMDSGTADIACMMEIEHCTTIRNLILRDYLPELKCYPMDLGHFNCSGKYVDGIWNK